MPEWKRFGRRRSSVAVGTLAAILLLPLAAASQEAALQAAVASPAAPTPDAGALAGPPGGSPGGSPGGLLGGSPGPARGAAPANLTPGLVLHPLGGGGLPSGVSGRATLALNVGAGRVVTLRAPASSLFAADPKVAEVRPASPTSLFVFGVAPGHTTVAALGEGGTPVAEIDVTVRPSTFGSSEVAGLVRAGVHAPGVTVDATPGGYRVTGHVGTPGDAQQVMASLRPYLAPGQTIDNRLAVEAPLTVNLRVRVVEVQRTVIRQLGINWNASIRAGEAAFGLSQVNRLIDATNLPDQLFGAVNGTQGGVNALIDALAQDQLAVILAEPNLTAQSGETASFLAGGEYPIPIAQQNNTITIEYKQYGVSLAFVPTVVTPERISLKVRPEVSELTNQGAVAISNNNFTLNIPALKVRRAETTVELGSGQSFAIAGLLSDNSVQNARGLPVLGELPVLGALFKSTAFQRGETELVIVVTPYLVRGVDDPSRLVVPTRGLALPNDLDRILYNRQRARGTAEPAPVHIPLDAGFITP